MAFAAVGEGDEATAEKRRRKLRNVHLLGRKPHEGALAYFMSVDMVVCASRDDPSPLCVLEAMAFGKGIVSTNIGAVPEVIEHEVSGIIIDVEDYQALAKSLIRLHQARDFLLRIGGAARRKFEERFMIERYGNDMIKLIKRVIRPGIALPQ